LAPNIYPAAAAQAAGRALVVSPRGMLGPDALRFSSLQKRIVWAAFQKNALASAAFIHATSEEECAEVRAMGLANPVVVIPNGVDVPPLAPMPKAAERIALSLGRIHPKKGLDRLIRAWDLAGKATAGWRLCIVGPDEGGHAAELKALAAGRGLTNVEISGPAYGETKLAAYRQASLFVLPTLNENFALTVAEALAAGTPVLATKGAPWAGLETERCGWWIDHGEAVMAEALKLALALPPSELAAMGKRGRAWMERDFSWDHIGRRMLAAYQWAVDGGDAPEEVRP
jgi:glycosyltransferase involved in cell wall biosynthesis